MEALLAVLLLAHLIALIMTNRSSSRNSQNDREKYGFEMMARLEELRSQAEKRRYMSSSKHIGLTDRCSCDLYALTFPETIVRDNEAAHGFFLCQPEREIIS